MVSRRFLTIGRVPLSLYALLKSNFKISVLDALFLYCSLYIITACIASKKINLSPVFFKSNKYQVNSNLINKTKTSDQGPNKAEKKRACYIMA